MNYRNTRNYENLNKRIFKGVGPYEIPQIEATHFESCEFIGFNYAAQAKKREEKGIHFFLDDYQFERLWKTPDRYLSMLYDFKYVMTPDFSTYTDFPKIIQIYNHYRKHWIGAYLQENGINGTYWAAGPWWDTYFMAITPKDGKDRPQMPIIEKYTSTLKK